MSRGILVILTLTVTYLLVLTSVQPGDVVVGGALATVVAVVRARSVRGAHAGPALGRRLAAAPALVAGTLADVVRGTWHVTLYVLGRRRLESPGVVTIPKGGRTPSGVAAWGYLTALSPDEIVVDVDDERGILLVHVLDARDPAAIRARHEATYRRRQRSVFP
jgi:multisubunit Na+/H+ antiporter MnhE subunit